MKTYIDNIDAGVQIRLAAIDEHMAIHDRLIEYLDNNSKIKKGKKVFTFETPISDYEFKDIPFSVLFDEMDSETFVFVGNEYDYKVIEQLINKFK